MKSQNITVTDARLKKALNQGMANSLGVPTETLSKNVQTNLNLVKCRVLRIYNTKQRVLVQILHNKKKVQAKILNPFLSRNVNINFSPDGSIGTDDDGAFVKPYDRLYGVILEFKDKTKKSADYCFLGYIDNETMDLNSNSIKGELLLRVNNNYISISEERINIKANNIFINGLPYGSPQLTNYYTKTEIDKIIEDLRPQNNNNSNINTGG